MNSTDANCNGVRSLGSGGFTLLEIVIAIAVLSLLAGTIVPMVGSSMADSKKAQAQAEVKAIVEAIGRYRLDTGTYPAGPVLPNIPGIAFCLDPAALVPHYTRVLVSGQKKYLSKPSTVDPWGRAYMGEITTAAGAIADVWVMSYGPDGIEQTSWQQKNQGVAAGDDILAIFDL